MKVDPERRMYGSVSTADIAHLFEEKGLPVTRNNIVLAKPLKEVGTHKIVLKLKEGVQASCTLDIIPEGEVKGQGVEKVVQPIPAEATTEEVSE